MTMRTSGKARDHERDRVREANSGVFGGQFVPEVLMPALDELVAAYADASANPEFQQELGRLSDQIRGSPYTRLSRSAIQRNYWSRCAGVPET